ncbi:MAG: cupin domain-containing protein [Nitrospirota bacterium]
MKKRKNILCCDWRKERFSIVEGEKCFSNTILYKHKGNFTWRGIRKEKYKLLGKGWTNIIRQTLIGSHGETAKFHVRYFEIAPGGYSSFEKHRHEHVVVGIRGKGICIAGKKKFSIGFLDTAYIAPEDSHQLRNPFKEPFGFLCIVNAKRDRPKIVTGN